MANSALPPTALQRIEELTDDSAAWLGARLEQAFREGFDMGRSEGHKEGQEEGREEGRREMLTRLHQFMAGTEAGVDRGIGVSAEGAVPSQAEHPTPVPAEDSRVRGSGTPDIVGSASSDTVGRNRAKEIAVANLLVNGESGIDPREVAVAQLSAEDGKAPATSEEINRLREAVRIALKRMVDRREATQGPDRRYRPTPLAIERYGRAANLFQSSPSREAAGNGSAPEEEVGSGAAAHDQQSPAGDEDNAAATVLPVAP